jgi:hypothetical protein
VTRLRKPGVRRAAADTRWYNWPCRAGGGRDTILAVDEVDLGSVGGVLAFEQVRAIAHRFLDRIRASTPGPDTIPAAGRTEEQ